MEKIPAFVALDLETTGLDFEKDEIIEVALVRFENGEPKDNLDFLVKPSSAELRPFIETLTGISKTDLDAAPDFATVAGQICSFIGDLPVVAHNALFDSKFLKQTFSKVGISYDNRLEWLKELAPDIKETAIDPTSDNGDAEETANKDKEHQQTAEEKIQEMIDRLNNQEFTRFWP